MSARSLMDIPHNIRVAAWSLLKFALTGPLLGMAWILMVLFPFLIPTVADGSYRENILNAALGDCYLVFCILSFAGMKLSVIFHAKSLSPKQILVRNEMISFMPYWVVPLFFLVYSLLFKILYQFVTSHQPHSVYYPP